MKSKGLKNSSLNDIHVILKPFNMERPGDDETVISFLKYIGDLNGISFGDLMRLYNVRSESQILRHAANLLEHFGADIDVFDIITEMTIYPAISCAIEWYMQLAFMASFQPLFNNFVNVIPNNNFYFDKYICPECAREELEKYGRYYYHRSHQIPGVSVCYKHGVKLIEVNENDQIEDILTGHNNELKMSDDELKLQLRYANFARLLLIKGGLNKSKKETCQMIRDAVIQKFGTKNYIEDCQRYIDDNNLAGFVGKGIKSVFNHATPGIDLMLKMLMLFCINDVVDENLVDLPTVPVSYKLEKYDANIMMITHRSCKCTFCWPTEASKSRILCPTCDDQGTDEQRFKLVAKSINPDYKIISSYKGINNSVKIIHKCGRECSCYAKNMYLPRRCECEKGPKPKEIKQEVEDIGYKLISIEIGRVRSETLVTVKCRTCGHVFTKSLTDLKSRPSCPKCVKKEISQIRRRDPREFRKMFNDLVGDEYVLLDDYSTNSKPVKILHKTCGHVTTMRPIEFLKGRRCELCDVPYGSEFKEYVRKATCGRYSVSGSGNGLNYDLTDHNTGKIISNISKLLIIQEIRRPTPSKLIDLSAETRKSAREIPLGILNYIRLSFRNNPSRDFTASDLENECYSSDEIEMRLRFMRRRGEIQKVGGRTYHWAGDPNLNQSRVVPKKTFEIKNVIFAAASVYKDNFTIAQIAKDTGYRKDQVGSALSQLVEESKVHRVAPGKYAIGEGDNFVYLSDRVMSYINENLFDSPFRAADITIDGINRSSINGALKHLANRGILKRIKTGVYALVDVDYDETGVFNSVYDYVSRVINKDVTLDYCAENIPETQEYNTQAIKSALIEMHNHGELYRVGHGIYHSIKDAEFDHSRIVTEVKGDIKNSVENLLKEKNEPLTVDEIVSLLGLLKKQVKGAILNLLKENAIHRTDKSTYAFGPGQNFNGETQLQRVEKLIRKDFSDGSCFNVKKLSYISDGMTNQQIRNALKRLCKKKIIIRRSEGIYVLNKEYKDCD